MADGLSTKAAPYDLNVEPMSWAGTGHSMRGNCARLPVVDHDNFETVILGSSFSHDQHSPQCVVFFIVSYYLSPTPKYSRQSFSLTKGQRRFLSINDVIWREKWLRTNVQEVEND